MAVSPSFLTATTSPSLSSSSLSPLLYQPLFLGSGVGVALLLALLAVVALVALLCVRRRRRTSKMIFQLQMTNFDYPIYEGKWWSHTFWHTLHHLFMTKYFTLYVCFVCAEVHWGSDGVVANHRNIPAVFDRTTYESSFSDCYSMATNRQSRKETVAEFHNPLYTNTCPVTFSEPTVYGSVSKHLSSLSLPNYSQYITLISISHVSLHTDWFWLRKHKFFTGMLLCSIHSMW